MNYKKTRTHRRAGLPAAVISLALSAGSAQATILNFDDLALFAFIPQTYGDRATGTAADAFVYGEGEGYTPNVVVEYTTTNTTTPFNVWNGYGNLSKALGHNQFNVLGDLVLRPDAGFRVALHSFDLGAFQANYANSRVQVLDLDGTTLFDTGVFTALLAPAGAEAGRYTFPGFGPLSSANGLRIVVTEFGDLGLDNISFSQTPVPVPAALPLFASAVAGVVALRRRRARG
jgi:hypothetical protein